MNKALERVNKALESVNKGLESVTKALESVDKALAGVSKVPAGLELSPMSGTMGMFGGAIMAANRIKKRPDELRDQLNQAAAAIAALALGGWPAEAPTAAAVTAAADAIDDSITAIEGLDNQAKTRRVQRDGEVVDGQDIMKLIDGFTTGLYGADGPEKNNFGLPPILLPAGPLAPPAKITDLKLGDGTLPASLFADCESIDGNTSYEWEWYSDAALTARVGNVTTTPSELTINGLTTGTRYWIRVRAIRGGQTGMWSDPDSRVANV